MGRYFPIEDPVVIFALVAALILLAPILLDRYRLPGMVGLLLAGAILGPHALGVLARDRSFVLFGTVGLLYIMFMAALEIDLAVIKRYRLHSIGFGLATFAIPQGLGFLAAHYVLGLNVPASILLGGVFASHTPLAYPIASRLGIATSRAVTTAIGGTLLADTSALMVLAAVAGSSQGEMNDAFWYRLVVSMAVYVALILIGLPRLARWFFRRVSRDGVSEFVFVLAAVFGGASLSHLAGIEPVVGAFLAGLALNRLIPPSSTLMSRIRFTGEAIFVPFFLLSVGMLLDVRIFMGGLRSWGIALTMLAVVTSTKWLAAEATRPVLRFRREEARVVFGLSVAHAAGALAMTMVGYEVGLFDDAVVNGAILMILGTCILAPLVVNKHGRVLADAELTQRDEVTGPAQRILVALAKPSAAHPLIELAQLIRDPAYGQPVYPLTVIEEGERATDAVAEAEQMLSKAVVQLATADVPASPLTRIDLNVPAGILRARRELRGTEVIVGWAGHASKADLFFGTLLEKLRADPHYTLVASRLVEPLNTCHRVVFLVPPNADQERSFAATIRLVKALARQLGAKVLVVSVKSHEDRVRKRMQSLPPSVDLATSPLRSWSVVTDVLPNIIKDGDFVALCGLRTGTPFWRSGIEHLAEHLARGFPSTNLLLVYAADPPDGRTDPEAAPADPATEEPRSLHRVVMGMSATSVADAVRDLITHVPGMTGVAAAAPLVDKLVDSAQELTAGVVVVHAQSEQVTDHALVIGVSGGGIVHAAWQSPAHVVLLLADPPERDATRHLQNLAAVARMFHSADVVTRARSAKSVDELRRLLHEVMR